MSDLTTLPVSALSALLRARKLSPVELVDVHIRRIEKVNPKINALAVPRFEAARREAQAAEARLREPDAPPLTGIPCTVKEFYKVEGMPWTGCTKRFKDQRADRDATVVRRLREAGAIILGSSNAPEGGLWMETYNDIYGRTSNPWDLRRTSGGSSGGEGALVATGASAFGIGSDVGGSIRIPAAFCGVVGHKPSGRRVPATGHFPEGSHGVNPYLGLGPLGRRVADLGLLLDVIGGPDGEDPACVAMPRIGEIPAGVKGLRVIPLEGNGKLNVRPVMRETIRKAAQALRDQGMTVEDRAFPRMAKGADIWTVALAEASDHPYEHIMTEGEGMSLRKQFARLPLGTADHTFAMLVVTAVERLNKYPIFNARKLMQERLNLQEELEEAMGEDGVILFPPYTRPAPLHRASWLSPFDAACTAMFNVLEFPGTVVPVGFTPDGLPLCVQVIAGRGQDALCLRVAQAIEAATGGWKKAMS